MPDASPWTDLARPPLRVAALRRALLDPAGPWTSLDVVPVTGSTNEDLAARAAAGSVRAGAVLATEHQVAGRGRHDRSWTAPARSSLAVSVLVVPTAPQSRWSWLPLLAGVAVAEALADVAGITATLKWPNDVLVEADGEWRKVCGVLAQVVPTPAGSGVVVGIGVNITQRAGELPVPGAASLATAAATTTDRDTVLRAVLRALGRRLADWQERPDELREVYTRLCRTLGRVVDVHLPGGAVERGTVLRGTATGVDDGGRLLVAPGDGSPVQALAAGDVVHVRHQVRG